MIELPPTKKLLRVNRKRMLGRLGKIAGTGLMRSVFGVVGFLPAYIANAAAESAARPGIIELLGLDWKLFLAQLINFGIVLWVLSRWVFKPVTRTLGARKARIEQALLDAQRIEQEKLKLAAEKEVILNQTRVEAGKLIEQAQAEAENFRQSLLEITKQEQKRLIQQSAQQLERQKQEANRAVRHHLAELVILATGRVLREKLDPEKDRRFIEQTVKNLPT